MDELTAINIQELGELERIEFRERMDTPVSNVSNESPNTNEVTEATDDLKDVVKDAISDLTETIDEEIDKVTEVGEKLSE